MRKWSTLFCALTAVALAPVALAQSLDEQARATRDAQRLDSAQRDFQSGNARNDERSARRQRQRDALQKTNALLDARRNNNQTLQQRVRLLDDDLAQLQAVTESTLQSQRRRLQLGPLAADRMDMIEQIDRLAEQPPSLATLYATWFSLHEEWLAGGQVTHLQQALTQSNGVRQTVPMTRFGAIALAYDGRRVLVTPDAGLLVGPLDAQAGTGIDYFLQQVYDSGAIGVALLLCALAAVVIIVRRRGFRLLSLIASASLLLGLLGTVVGLIHTFRALARYGGADASLAAAGISHALATTWMGLVLAITLMLVSPVVAHWQERAPRLRPTATSGLTRWPTLWRPPLAFGLALGLGFGLFYLMQWLTARPLSPPAAPEPVIRVERIDWSTPPPPPPPPERAVTLTDSPPASPSFALIEATALPAPAPALDAPNLNIAPGVSGLGDGDLPAAGTLWRGASGSAGIVNGNDLVPISSARPRYPQAALQAGIDGWVEAIFRIDASGRVSNVRIIDAEPPGVFEQSAAQALERWLYAPLYRDGKPVAREATQLLRFQHREARNTYTDGGR